MKKIYRWFDWIVLLIILAFIILWLFKINGYFDFSGKYHIKELYANKEYDNIQLLLDGEEKTKWGELTEHEVGDYISIRFRKKVCLSEVILVGEVQDIPSKLSFETQIDGKSMELRVEKKSYNTYVIISKTQLDNMQIRILEGNADNNWLMSEIEFVFQEK